MKKLSVLFVSLILIAAIMAGCASKSAQDKADYDTSPGGNNGGYWGGAAPAPAAPAEGPDYEKPSFDEPAGDPQDNGYLSDVSRSINAAELADQMGSKIIKSGYMSIETLDFEETTSAIERRVQQEGGFVASSNIQGWSRQDAESKPMRSAHYKVRIPSNRFEQFMTDVGELGNVTRSESWGEDVTSKYFDTEARLKSLTIQEERLLTLLSKAEILSDILELERELASVRYEIENLTGTLRKYDNLVAYSTLEIDVREVEEIKKVEEKPVTLWDKIARAFNRSIENVAKMLENLLLFLIGALPFLVVLGVFVLIVYGLLRLIGRKDRKNVSVQPIIQKNQNLNDNKEEQK